jgi:hypothetical protein
MVYPRLDATRAFAPRTVEFFSQEGKKLGSRESTEQQILEVTGVHINALRGTPLSEFDVEERFSWAKGRQTTRKEDKVYSLLGIFGISMIPNYGEGEEHANKRLRRRIEKSLDGAMTLNNSQMRTLLRSLRFEQMGARQTNIKNAHPATCEWLLRKPEFLQWKDPAIITEHHGFLWVKGKPGTSKSTLMKYALADARETMKERVVISFFFNAHGNNLERSTFGAYRSLLLQILERIPSLQFVFDLLDLTSDNVRPDYA